MALQCVLAEMKRSILPCKPGQFMDKLLSQCADCSIACYVPTSDYCKRVCPGWLAISPSSPPPLSNSSPVAVLTIVMPLVCIAIIGSVLFAVFIVRRQSQQLVNHVEEGTHLQRPREVDAVQEEA
ncbi:hypothetical protein LSAT2_024932 [Lamellibrachia satsuma]|nr:hypothetical protein LSAT2_024932 [Lamellibrachia satsuma]